MKNKGIRNKFAEEATRRTDRVARGIIADMKARKKRTLKMR